MDYKGEKPRGSRRKITGACLNGPLALIEQDPGTTAIRVKRSHTLIVGSRSGSTWPRPFWQLEGCCGKSESMPAAYSFNSCRTLQQVSHSGVAPLRMRGSKRHLKQEKGTSREAHVAVRLAALGRLPQRVEVGKGGNWRPEGEAIVAEATDLCRQRSACQRVLLGIDLGHSVHDAGRASALATCLARRLQHWGSRGGRGAKQGKQPARAEAEGQAKDSGRLEGTIITGRCHKQLLSCEHVERGNCGRP